MLKYLTWRNLLLHSWCWLGAHWLRRNTPVATSSGWSQRLWVVGQQNLLELQGRIRGYFLKYFCLPVTHCLVSFVIMMKMCVSFHEPRDCWFACLWIFWSYLTSCGLENHICYFLLFELSLLLLAVQYYREKSNISYIFCHSSNFSITPKM